MGGQGLLPPLAAPSPDRQIDGCSVIIVIGGDDRRVGQIAQREASLVAQDYAGALRARTEGQLGHALEQGAQLGIFGLKFTHQCRQLLDIQRQVTGLRRHAPLYQMTL